MANKTSNYGLTKPFQTEFYDIDVHNANMDIIDAQLKDINDKFNGLSTDAGDMTGTLPIEHGGTGATTASKALTNLGAAPSNHDHHYAGSSAVGGSATSAERLVSGKTIKTDLAKTSATKFDGTENVEVGVTGVLPVANGGTGANSVANAQSAFGIVPMNDIPNLHIWEKYDGDPNIPAQTPVSGKVISYTVNNMTTLYMDVQYADSAVIIDGEITLVNPTAAKISNNASSANASVLLGKYIYSEGTGLLSNNKEFLFIPSDATFTYGSTSLSVSKAQKLTIRSHVNYVASKENNTYPTNGKHTDGYWYKYSKQLGDTDPVDEPDYTYGTADLTAGSSALETGKLYFVYE